MSKPTPYQPDAVIAPLQDAELGALLTAQYHKAVGAMPEVLRFGAMLIRLEQHILSTHGQVSKGGRSNTDGSVAEWLRQHAPEVARTTALRFRDVTLGIAESYKELVGEKIARQFALADLVVAEPDELPEPARKKQQALFEYIAGTSQRSWLDKIRPVKAGGGNTYERTNGKGKRTRLTQAEALKLLREVAVNTMQHVRYLHDQKAYVPLKPAELDGLIDHLQEALQDAKAWRDMTEEQRTAALAEQVKRKIAAKAH